MKKEIKVVCDDCGVTANRLTVLEKHGQEPIKAKFDCSTYHLAKCDCCGLKKQVTEVRDFFYPNFDLLINPK